MAEKEKFTIVVFSGDLDKAMAAFIMATTAASMGMEVTMFFTFWGLNIIKRNKGGIKMIPCSTSCGVLGLPDDSFRSGIMSQAGAAYFLGQARVSKVTLFI